MTTIQWTDETWNPTTGCSRVSEGCRHCYIERTPPFRMAGRKLGDPVQLHPDRLDAPLHWKKPRRVFVNSLSDLFHEEVPDEFIDRVFAAMAMTRRHTYQVLTKRPLRLLEYMKSRSPGGWPIPKFWLGVSVEDQQTADERIPILLQVPAAVRFLSVEPLLGPVDLYRGGFSFLERLKSPSCKQYEKVDWVIVGGESGPKSRPCDLSWIRSIVQQCKGAAVPCFVKQLGSLPFDVKQSKVFSSWAFIEHGRFAPPRFYAHFTDKKGGNPEEWPADLRVREWPR